MSEEYIDPGVIQFESIPVVDGDRRLAKILVSCGGCFFGQFKSEQIITARSKNYPAITGCQILETSNYRQVSTTVNTNAKGSITEKCPMGILFEELAPQGPFLED